MLTRFISVVLLGLAGVGSAQRGGWSDLRGGWDDSPAQQVVTETQMETRTLVSTAPARPPTTVVQATTVLRVSTVQVQAQPSTITLTADGRTYTTTTSLTPSPSLSTLTRDVLPQNVSQDGGLTVDPLGSETPLSGSGSNTASSISTSSPAASVPASTSISLVTTPTSDTGENGTPTGPSRTADMPDFTGMEVETTGTPYMRDAAEGVVYGSIANNGAGSVRIPLPSPFLTIPALLWTFTLWSYML